MPEVNAILIEQEDRGLQARAHVFHPEHQRLERLRQRPARGDHRQHAVLSGERLLGVLAFADVLHHRRGVAARAGFVADEFCCDMHPRHLPILAYVTLLHVVERRLFPKEAAQPLAIRLAIVRVVQVERRPGEQFLAAVAGDRAVAVAHPHEAALATHLRRAQRDVVKEAAEICLAREQRSLAGEHRARHRRARHQREDHPRHEQAQRERLGVREHGERAHPAGFVIRERVRLHLLGEKRLQPAP